MARRLRVTIAWLRGEADAGRVPCLKAGPRYLFSPEAVEYVLAVRAADERLAEAVTRDSFESTPVEVLSAERPTNEKAAGDV